jgi:hypothetical protein
MALNWPIRCEVEFFDYVYMEGDIPVYYMGSRMCHRMTLTNMTDTLGNAREWIEDLKVRVRQGEATGSDVLGVGPQSIQWLLTVLLLDSGEVASVSLSNSYAVPQSAAAGPNGTLVGLGFRFAGRSMAIEVTYTQAEGL